MCSIWGWSPLRWFYGKFYGSAHCLVVTLMVHCHSWPFRLDIIYFRWLSTIQVGWPAGTCLGGLKCYACVHAWDTRV